MHEKEKILQLLKEVKEDENYKAFYARFEALRIQSLEQDILSEIKAENDYGNTEYKLKFDHPTVNRVDQLTT